METLIIQNLLMQWVFFIYCGDIQICFMAYFHSLGLDQFIQFSLSNAVYEGFFWPNILKPKCKQWFILTDQWIEVLSNKFKS